MPHGGSLDPAPQLLWPFMVSLLKCHCFANENLSFNNMSKISWHHVAESQRPICAKTRSCALRYSSHAYLSSLGSSASELLNLICRKKQPATQDNHGLRRNSCLLGKVFAPELVTHAGAGNVKVVLKKKQRNVKTKQCTSDIGQVGVTGCNVTFSG